MYIVYEQLINFFTVSKGLKTASRETFFKIKKQMFHFQTNKINKNKINHFNFSAAKLKS